MSFIGRHIPKQIFRQTLQYQRHSFTKPIPNVVSSIHQTSHFSTSATTTTTPPTHHHQNLIVIGSGVAGCATALTAALDHNIPVTLLHAGSLATDCNSYWAQGGIIHRNPRPTDGDSAESLVNDIHRAGAGLCWDGAVRKVAKDGPRRVQELLLRVAQVPFDRDDLGELLFCLEASHSAPRIIHHADATGKAITESITRAALSHPLITTIPSTIVTDLVLHPDDSNACLGVQTLHTDATGAHTQDTLLSHHGVVIASGGLANIYLHSSNPGGFNALGSGVALALRAGAAVADLEYVQFHPTTLNLPPSPTDTSSSSRFLLTEALRGEGAILRDPTGRPFARDFHPDGELAPRDVVARAVFATNQQAGGAFLDITHRDAAWLKERFPTIAQHLSKRGWDLTKDCLPVVPAAHYSCGGVVSDLEGRASVMGLYVAGEAARTGLHGGNRLASTSLLEGLVYGASVADCVGASAVANEGLYFTENEIKELYAHHQTFSQMAVPNGALGAEESAKVSLRAKELLQEVRQTMWDKVGVVRIRSETQEAVQILGGIKEEACHLFDKVATPETSALRDAAFSSEAVAKAASENRVSAGAHYVMDSEEEEEEQDVVEKVSTCG